MSKPLTPEQVKSFEEAAEPLIIWINKHCHPHHHIIVDHVHAELSEGLVSIRNEKHLKD